MVYIIGHTSKRNFCMQRSVLCQSWVHTEGDISAASSDQSAGVTMKGCVKKVGLWNPRVWEPKEGTWHQSGMWHRARISGEKGQKVPGTFVFQKNSMFYYEAEPTPCVQDTFTQEHWMFLQNVYLVDLVCVWSDSRTSLGPSDQPFGCMSFLAGVIGRTGRKKVERVKEWKCKRERIILSLNLKYLWMKTGIQLSWRVSRNIWAWRQYS